MDDFGESTSDENEPRRCKEKKFYKYLILGCPKEGSDEMDKHVKTRKKCSLCLLIFFLRGYVS